MLLLYVHNIKGKSEEYPQVSQPGISPPSRAYKRETFHLFPHSDPIALRVSASFESWVLESLSMVCSSKSNGYF